MDTRGLWALGMGVLYLAGIAFLVANSKGTANVIGATTGGFNTLVTTATHPGSGYGG
jgi:hypothetical protein